MDSRNTVVSRNAAISLTCKQLICVRQICNRTHIQTIRPIATHIFKPSERNYNHADEIHVCWGHRVDWSLWCSITPGISIGIHIISREGAYRCLLNHFCCIQKHVLIPAIHLVDKVDHVSECIIGLVTGWRRSNRVLHSRVQSEGLSQRPRHFKMLFTVCISGCIVIGRSPPLMRFRLVYAMGYYSVRR